MEEHKESIVCEDPCGDSGLIIEACYQLLTKALFLRESGTGGMLIDK